MEETKVYDSTEFQNAFTQKTIMEVALILEERGYDPVNQIVGYLMSGDPGYISSHKEARKKIMKFDKAKILESMVRKYLNK
ncbi:MAG: IreB family regulatory phosphoprotein [Bacilli bacterium]|nr:IreB family regulatory phosphoprotein [Bacilli bacterium]